MPSGCSAPLSCLSAPSVVPPAPPWVCVSQVSSPCRSSSSVHPLPFPLFRAAWPFVPPPHPAWFVLPGCRRPAARFHVSCCCCLVFSLAFALGTCSVGFLFPPSARGRSSLCALRAGAVPPTPRRLLLVVCGAPRLVVRCRGSMWAVLCGVPCLAAPCCAVVRVPCCVVCCSAVLLALSLAVSRWRWPGPYLLVPCAVSPRVWCRGPLSCAVVFSVLLCGVMVVAVFSLCLLGSAHLWVCAAWCCPPPPLVCVSCLLPVCVAVLCWLVLCFVALCCCLLCCVFRGAACCCGVPCPVVLREWCGAALGFLVRLRLAACSAVLGGAVLCCRALRRSARAAAPRTGSSGDKGRPDAPDWNIRGGTGSRSHRTHDTKVKGHAVGRCPGLQHLGQNKKGRPQPPGPGKDGSCPGRINQTGSPPPRLERPGEGGGQRRRKQEAETKVANKREALEMQRSREEDEAAEKRRKQDEDKTKVTQRCTQVDEDGGMRWR